MTTIYGLLHINTCASQESFFRQAGLSYQLGTIRAINMRRKCFVVRLDRMRRVMRICVACDFLLSGNIVTSRDSIGALVSGQPHYEYEHFANLYQSSMYGRAVTVGMLWTGLQFTHAAAQ
jgi:hypothetical protein